MVFVGFFGFCRVCPICFFLLFCFLGDFVVFGLSFFLGGAFF